MSETPFLDGFAQLQAIFDQQIVASEVAFDEPAFERLRMALANPASRSPLELAVLIRHVLGYENGRRHSENDAMLRIPTGSGWPSETHWRQVSLNAQQQPDSWHVRSTWWRPAWLPDSERQSVDWAATVAESRPPVTTKRLLTDVFLSRVGVDEYRSPSQCRAARTILTAPPGATILTTLPTGEGKSLLFQLVDRVGFPDSQGLGVTLVIVPTVTLAIDHEQSARKLPLLADRPPDQPLAYVGNDSRKLQIREALRTGQQGLCFASPESACGSLRPALLAAANAGRVRALVVDEAHLIDGWGTDFRTEFQLLGGLWSELNARSPVTHRPRTLLLSATLTPMAVQALQQLFADAQTLFMTVGTLRLRPEIEFWIAPFTDVVTRQEHCLEALAHVPRPAILYTTTVEDAVNWRDKLRKKYGYGYRALRVVTGDTSAEEREQILKAWRNGAVDLVVATAAFGMGVDYASVRAVIHACIPETLDRFYQEVGRSGRDGCASLSLLLPAYEDLKIAKSLNQKAVISVDRGLTRWRSLFDHALPGRNLSERIVNLDTPPSMTPEDINMLGIRNSDWNARTLALMARAGLIQLLGTASTSEITAEYTVDNLMGMFQRVHLLDDSHYELERWQQIIEPLRQAIYHHNRVSLQHLLSVIRGRTCMAHTVVDLYTLKISGQSFYPAAVCTGCPWCRAHQEERTATQIARPLPLPQWQNVGLCSPANGLFDRRNLALIFYQLDELTGRKQQRRLREAIEQLINLGLLRLIGIGGGLALISSEQREKLVCRRIFMTELEETLQLPTMNIDMPRGPEFLIIGENSVLQPTMLESRPLGQERLILVPENQPDPLMPQRRLRDVYAVPGFSLDDFIRRVLS